MKYKKQLSSIPAFGRGLEKAVCLRLINGLRVPPLTRKILLRRIWKVFLAPACAEPVFNIVPHFGMSEAQIILGPRTVRNRGMAVR